MRAPAQAAALAHALKESPKESCGLLVLRKGRERYWPCRNDAQSEQQFVLNAEDYAAAEETGEVLAVVHSHPGASPRPSGADVAGCELSGVEWHIVGLPSGEWRTIIPCGYKAPLLGREFYYGAVDCFTIVQDWYAEKGVKIERVPSLHYWWKNGQNIYVDNFERAGFVPATGAPVEGDVFLMTVESAVPNHIALYLGDEIIVHHLGGRLSSRDIYGDYYQKNTTHVLRYAGGID